MVKYVLRRCDDTGYSGEYNGVCDADTGSGYILNEGVAVCNTNLGLTFGVTTNQCVCNTDLGLTSVDNQCKCDTSIVGISTAAAILSLILKIVRVNLVFVIQTDTMVNITLIAVVQKTNVVVKMVRVLRGVQDDIHPLMNIQGRRGK